jgi:hypothetical protein
VAAKPRLLTKQPHLAAKTQPQLQKLLGRIQATSHDRDFSQEDQKGRRASKDLGFRAAARELDAPFARRRRGDPPKTF